jgi:hypothetical protein
VVGAGLRQGDTAVRIFSSIAVHELIGIFVHASAVLRWGPGSVRLRSIPADERASGVLP